MSTDIHKSTPKSTGRTYSSVQDLIKGEGYSQEVRAGYQEAVAATRLTQQLAQMRIKAGITQESMATHLGVTQSAISKLESGLDEDLTIRQIRAYAEAASQRIGIAIGKPLNHVEAIKAHAIGMQKRLMALAAIAREQDELEREIQAFFGNAFFNLLTIMADCQQQMPNGGEFEIRLEVHDGPRHICSQKSEGLALV
jgi:transcriptional regulator with XRE-family HTH domain